MEHGVCLSHNVEEINFWLSFRIGQRNCFEKEHYTSHDVHDFCTLRETKETQSHLEALIQGRSLCVLCTSTELIYQIS